MFTPEELKAIYQIINELSGFNAGNVFARDGTDTLDDPTISAMAKLFRAVGRSDLIPKHLRGEM